MPAPDTKRDIGSALARVPSWAWFTAAVLVQLVLIFSLVAGHYATVAGGAEVRLRIAPVDPRDPLRGDYLSFHYDVNRVPREGAPSDAKAGQVVYVPLTKGDRGVWAYEPPMPLRTAPPGKSGSMRPDVVYIRGVLKEVPEALSGRDLTLTYGIEEYFVPEGKAAAFPSSRVLGAPRGEPVAVAAVAVAPDGAAVLKQVYVDGRPWP